MKATRLLQEELDSLFARRPDLWGFSVRADAEELYVSDIGISPRLSAEQYGAIYQDIAEPAADSESAELRERVAAARARQLARAGKLNARLDTRSLWRVVKLGAAERALLKRATERWRLSARSALRVLKVARTLADLAGRETVVADDVAEALQLRCRDRP